MTLHVDPPEAVWVTVTVATFILTLIALWDTWIAIGVVRALNGHAREIAAIGNFRREVVRLFTQTLLLVVAVPSLFSDRQVNWSLPLVALTLVPVSLFVNSLLDTTDRRRVLRAVASSLKTDVVSLDRIEAKIDAAAAVVENDHRATEKAVIAAERIETIGKDTNDRAKDIQERLP